MTLYEAIRARRSIRAFQDKPVPEEALSRILEAAVCAPSASNRQPWRFIVVSDAKVRGRMAESAREAVRRMAPDVQPEFEAGFLDYSRHFVTFEQAPLLLVALAKADQTFASLFKEESVSRERMRRLERDGSSISVAMAVQNLLLAATEEGLGTCVMTGPLLAEEDLVRILPVPEGWAILCLVCLGRPAEEAPTLRKKTAEQVTCTVKQGDIHDI